MKILIRFVFVILLVALTGCSGSFGAPEVPTSTPTAAPTQVAAVPNATPVVCPFNTTYHGYVLEDMKADTTKVLADGTKVICDAYGHSTIIDATRVPEATYTVAPPSNVSQVATAVPTASGTTVATSASGASVNAAAQVSPFPTLFDAQSTGKGVIFTYDIGVNPGQVGIVFGQLIAWNNNASGDVKTGCGLVVLNGGWTSRLTIVDGRYEIYTLPMGDAGFWMAKLANERMLEQRDHYGCPDKSAKDIPVWSAPDMPSPPKSVQDLWNGPASALQPQATAVAQATQSPAATTVPNAGTQPTAASSQGARRTTENKPNKTITFTKGEPVIGFLIKLSNGKTYSQCFLANPSMDGSVTDGVVWPFEGEIAAAKACTP